MGDSDSRFSAEGELTEMPETLCGECGKPYTPTYPACQRSRALQSTSAPEEPKTEEIIIITYEEPIVPISQELDDIDKL